MSSSQYVPIAVKHVLGLGQSNGPFVTVGQPGLLLST